MAKEPRFPGFRRLPGRAERFENIETGEEVSRREAEKARGTPLKEAPRVKTEKKLPGGYKEHNAWKRGRELHSTRELKRFIERSKSDCFYDDFLLGGKPPETPYPPRPPGSQGYPKWSEGGAARIPMRQRFESRAMDRGMLLQVISESKNLLEVASKLRPDIPMEGAHVYGWTMREGAC